ncbi:hypothetical protein EN881_34645, partial [Mesorhizobium sp. M7A.F.Ca.AU.002.04.1.1]
RQTMLQNTFIANHGLGTPTLNSFVVSANGTATAQAMASYSMPPVPFPCPFLPVKKRPSEARSDGR